MKVDLAKLMKSTAPVTVLFTNGIYLGVITIIYFLVRHVASGASSVDALWINVLVALIGGLCGWVVGTGLAPYTRKELKRFKNISVAVSAFLSGYVVSKFDRLLELALFQSPAANAIAWERVGLFIATFLATSLMVFINRFYSLEDDERDHKERTAASVESR